MFLPTLLAVLTFFNPFHNVETAETTQTLSMNDLAYQVVYGENAEDRLKFVKVHSSEKTTAVALERLQKMYSDQQLLDVLDYMKGNKQIDDFGIDENNARGYLSAAKWIDLTQDLRDFPRSSYKVRLQCLRVNQAIHSFDAMSWSDHQEFLAYDKIPEMSERQKLYALIRNDLAYVPEWSDLQMRVMRMMFASMKQLSNNFPSSDHPTTIIFRGNSGSGKSYQTANHEFTKGISTKRGPLNGIINTDSFRIAMSNITQCPEQAPLFVNSVALQRALSEVLDGSPFVFSQVKDGWFDSYALFEPLIKKSKSQNGSVKIVDLEVPLLTSSLRVLARSVNDSTEPRPPFSAVVSGFVRTRNGRSDLIQKMKSEDVISNYQFIAKTDGGAILVAEKKNHEFRILDQNLYDQSIAIISEDESKRLEKMVAGHKISQEDVETYGNGLHSFLGMTVGDAYGMYLKLPSTHQKVTLLSTSDTHSHLEPYRDKTNGLSVGGMARRAEYFYRTRVEQPNTLILDAGDIFQGDSIFKVSKGAAEIQTMNLAGYDALTVGNHDFDLGIARLLEVAKIAEFPILCANIKSRATNDLLFKPYYIFQKGGKKIALVGLMGPSSFNAIHPKIAADLLFEDPVETAERLVSHLREEVDIIIGLTHGGVAFDRMLAQLPLFDIIFGGHDHKLILGEQWDNARGGTILTHSYKYGQYVTRLNLQIEESRLNLYEAKAEQIDDAYNIDTINYVDEVIQPFLDAVEHLGSTSLGILKRPLSKSKDGTGYSPLGFSVADSTREQLSTDVGIIPTGSIKDDLAAGEISLRDLEQLLPHTNSILRLRVKGAFLKYFAEENVKRANGSGTFQFAGVRYDIEAGHVNRISIDGKPYDQDEEYTVAIDEFCLEREIRNGLNISLICQQEDLGYTAQDCFKAYIEGKLGVFGDELSGLKWGILQLVTEPLG